MGDSPRGRRIPVWVFILVFAAVAIVAGLAGWLLGHQSPTAVVPAPTVEITPTVPPETSPAVTVPATSTVEPTATPKPQPKTTKEWAFLTGGFASGGKLYIKADYISFYTPGAAANAAQVKYGGSLRPDGSYVRNTSSTIRTLTLKPTAQIELVEWLETGTAGSSFKYGKADPNAFVAVLAGTATSPSGVWSPADKAILLTVTGSTVSAVQQYSPGA
jgi:hypothetical protein